MRSLKRFRSRQHHPGRQGRARGAPGPSLRPRPLQSSAPRSELSQGTGRAGEGGVGTAEPPPPPRVHTHPPAPPSALKSHPCFVVSPEGPGCSSPRYKGSRGGGGGADLHPQWGLGDRGRLSGRCPQPCAAASRPPPPPPAQCHRFPPSLPALPGAPPRCRPWAQREPRGSWSPWQRRPFAVTSSWE